MADYAGVEQGILREDVAPVAGSLVVIKSTIIKASLPNDQVTKTMTISLADAADMFFVGNIESATLVSAFEGGDSVITQDNSTLELFKNYTGSATLLGNVENDVLNNLTNGTVYTGFICSQDQIRNLTGYLDSLKVMTTLTGTFLATEIVENLIFTANPSRTSGSTRNAEITFNKSNLPDLINGHFDNIDVTLSGS